MPHVLIWDNSKDVLEMFRYVFSKQEFKVSVCEDEDCLFKNLRSAIPDLMIIDVWNSNTIKDTICNELRKRTALKKTPMIVTSTRQKDIEHFKDHCADDALEKPFDLSLLMTKVNSLLATAGLNV